MTSPEGPNVAMPELPPLAPEVEWAMDFAPTANVVHRPKAEAWGLAFYAAGVKAGMERAAGIAEDTIVAEYEGVESYGNLAAAAIRKDAEK